MPQETNKVLRYQIIQKEPTLTKKIRKPPEEVRVEVRAKGGMTLL